MRDTIAAFLILVAIAAVIVFAVWFTFAAPCSWHAGTAVKDLPARCLPGAQ